MKRLPFPHCRHRVVRLTVIALCCTVAASADTWWIGFRDKAGSEGDLAHPATFLSERALQRRLRQNIAIDSLDLPVSRTYTDSLQRLGAEIVHVSRWMNGISCQIDEEAVAEQIAKSDFVIKMERTQRDISASASSRRKLPAASTTPSDYGVAALQAEMLGLPALHAEGFRGEGIQIAVVDNGFYNADRLACFDHLQERILGTRDFVEPGNSVYAQGEHGSMVLSCIAARTSDYEGAAPEASYYLFRTEDDRTESLRETDAQVAAFELADSLGADIITTSLGYAYGFSDGTPDLVYAQMDGQSQRNSRAATIAARKGIVVCAAMGNEGNKAWHYLTTPADADSILSVGSVTATGEQSPFSSFGPSADGRTKPEICALGSSAAVVNPTTGETGYSNGTSFATPLIAGMTACLWSALPELSNMQLMERIVESASQYHYPDNCLGYGIPNAWFAYSGEANALPAVGKEASLQWTTDTTEVFDMQGRRLGNSVSGLGSGLYLVRNGQHTRKILIP